jgi:hypothetical protein
MEIKKLVTNLEKLEERLEAALSAGLTDFIARTKERRITVIRNRRYAITSIGVLIFSFMALFIAHGYLSGSTLNLVTMYLLALCTATLLFNHHWYREQKLLTQELNLALIPIITSAFGRLVMYTHHDTYRGVTAESLKNSGLMPEDFDVVLADDMFTFFEPSEIKISEISVERKGQKRSHRLFQGVLAEVTLPRTLSGVTYISTEGDAFGFLHTSFWGNLGRTEKVKETILEWNQFEDDLHVATNNEVEAREILTTDFMVDLHDWWSEHKENIRIVFRGNKMQVLLRDHAVRIGTSTTSTKQSDLKKYAMSIARPIWRILILAEGVKMR